MTRFRSGRVPHQHIGISSFTEDKLVLDVIGNATISGTLSVGVGTNNSGNGNISIGGTTGTIGQYLKSTGVGVTWADFADVRDSQSFVATAGQTTFVFTANELNQYNPNFIDVYVNGVKLINSEYDAFNGSNVVLKSACFAGDIVELISYNTNQITNGMGGSTIGINTFATSTFTHINASGVITATSYYGDGSNLTGITTSLRSEYADVSGISTISQGLTGTPDITVGNINVGIATFTGNLDAVDASFSGNVSIGGTLTYEDVKNVDSIGLITARNGIDASGSIKGFDYLEAPHSNDVITITVKVVDKTTAHRYFGNGSAKGYTFNDVESPFLTLTPGRTYRFDQSDNSNLTHQLRFYLDAARNIEYLRTPGEIVYNGAAGSSGSYTEIEIFDDTPTLLYYQCVNHGYMGNAVQINTGHAIGLATAVSIDTTGIITAFRYYGDGTYLSGVQSQLVIQEEGSPVGTAGTINFVGAAVTASVSSDIATIEIGNYYSNVAGIATVAEGLTGSPNVSVSGLTAAGIQIAGLCTASTFVGNVVGSIAGGNWGGYDSTATNNVSAGQSVTAGNGFYGDGSNLTNLVKISDTAPSNATGGNLWWKSDEGQLKIYYQDTDSAQWVDANASGGSGSSGGSSDLLNDSTPQLGGTLDLNNNDISGTGNISINGGLTLIGGTSNIGNLYSSGIITATTFYGNSVGDVSGTVTGNVNGTVNATGLSTFTTVDINGDVNVSGASTLTGSLDVTDRVDAHSINVSTAVTAVEFHGDGQYLTNIYSAPPQGISTTGYTGLTNLFCGGYLEVDGQSILDDVIVSAAATFQGALSANTGPVTLNNATINGHTSVTGVSTFAGAIDVDGHTELDNVNVSGIVTFSGDVSVGSSILFGDNKKAIFGDNAGGYLEVYSSGADSIIKSNTDDLWIYGHDNIFLAGATSNHKYLRTTDGGTTALYFNNNQKFETTNTGAIVTGILTATNGYFGNVNVNNQNIEVGNCTTAGVDNTIKVGTNALEIHHRTSAYSTYIQNKADTNLFLAGNDTNGTWGNIFIRPYLSNFSGVACWWGGATELYYGNNNSKKLATTSGGVTITGTLSKSGGSFKIPHPVAGLSTTKHLVHSFLEGPQMDLIYRGKIDLVGGTATVNIDTKSGMTEGTFVLLNRDVQCFTSNETGWTAVKGSVSGNILTITAQDNSCTDTISWMVVGERQDDTVKSLDMTDSEGNLIIEIDQPAPDTKHADVQAQL